MDTTTADCPVCITNHACINLDGTIGDVKQHWLRMESDLFLPVNAELIPLGTLAEVEGTSFDFRAGKPIQADWLLGTTVSARQPQPTGMATAPLLAGTREVYRQRIRYSFN